MNHVAEVRDAQAFQDVFGDVVYEGARTLEVADAQAGEPRRWWTGVVQGVHGLEVGFVFDLRRELPATIREHLGRYRLVAMAVNPEGHYALVAYEEDFDPPNGRQVPVVALMAHLVPR